MRRLCMRGHRRLGSYRSLRRPLCSSSSPTAGAAASERVAPAGCTIVDDRETAERVAAQLSEAAHERPFACDTEVDGFDARMGPINNGQVICLSIYGGNDLNFGCGPAIWVDTLDDMSVLEPFREFLADKEAKKVWHNYSFDRHVLHNHDFDVQGLGADTMHMARLWDSARGKDGGYSLASLTNLLLDHPKRTMKDIFGRNKIKKDGTEGKEIIVPSPAELQTELDTRSDWIKYSVDDSIVTLQLYRDLEAKLKLMPWSTQIAADGSFSNANLSMFEFYKMFFVPFAECLTDMEGNGIAVDVSHLHRSELQALGDRDKAEGEFVEWAASFWEEARLMNISSDQQKQQLLFAPAQNSKRPEDSLPEERAFLVENTTGYIEQEKIADKIEKFEQKQERAPTAEEIGELVSTIKPKKNRSITLKGMGLPPIKYTGSGWPAVSYDVLTELAGKCDADPPKYGPAYDFFDGGEEGERACKAIHSLLSTSSIDTMLSNFILPLQEMSSRNNGRVHCSMNLNTETGRLSARRPNLQNQPALEKDRYRIRDAFTCAPGNLLLVADYGQLELRLLAQIAQCESMFDAFESGGDFHSRTAMSMYPHVEEAVQRGEALLEWDYRDGKPPAPLLKDAFAAERRKAKVLNFSIAYGKTPHGLSKDFGVTVAEAKETLDAWYNGRDEVKLWQDQTIATAYRTGYTRTILGRHRHLPDIFNMSRQVRSHGERAAINTPIQGSAADVVMAAMLKIHSNERLKQLGWKMLLQIHDEIIAEGPEETAPEAKELLVSLMEHPFPKPLRVALTVDANLEKTWYKAK